MFVLCSLQPLFYSSVKDTEIEGFQAFPLTTLQINSWPAVKAGVVGTQVELDRDPTGMVIVPFTTSSTRTLITRSSDEILSRTVITTPSTDPVKGIGIPGAFGAMPAGGMF